MPSRRGIIWTCLIALTIIALDEFGYFVWRRRNPGEHFSHLTDPTGLQNWDETIIGEGNLNRVWSGRF